MQGKVHSPSFLFRCTAGDVSADGQGKQKKIAKHEAAQEVIKQMFGQSGAGDKSGLSNMPSLNKDGMTGNPIGQLQELTQKNKWAPPDYSFLDSENYPTSKPSREFKCVCTLGKGYEQTAGARSKRTAKRNAATAMLNYLKQSAGITTEEIDKTALDGMAAHMQTLQIDQTVGYANTKDGLSSVPTINQQASKQIRQFYSQMKNSTAKWLGQLQSNPLSQPGLNYCQFLQQIAEEQRFEVTYVDIHEPTVQGMPQCLVQLSTMPVAVCHGTGTTPDNAHAHAALNALEYLKIMTKKA